MNQPKDNSAERASQARAQIARFHAELNKKNHYQLFGVDAEELDLERLKLSYHALAKRWHADAYTGLELGRERVLLDEIFQHISDAYATLTDPARQAEYRVLVDRKSKGLATDVNAILEAEGQVDEALACMRRKDWGGARSLLESAVSMNPDDPLYMAYLGWAIFNQTGRSGAEAAVERLKAAIKRQESLPVAYQYLGQIYFTLDKHDEAKKWWRLCLEWEPKNIEASRGLRLIATRSQKKEAGLAGFVKKLFRK